MVKASIQLYKNAYSGITGPIWGLAAVMFVNRCGTMVIPFLTVYLTAKGYSLAQAGYVMGAFGCGAIIGAFLGGRLTDRFGFYYVQFFSLLLSGLLFFLLAQMQTLTQFIICIFILSSVGEAFRPANAAAIAACSTEANRTRSYSLNRLAINLGWAVGPAVGGLLASFNYQLLFWVDGGTCIVASLVLILFLPKAVNASVSINENREERTSSAYKDKVFLQGMFYVFLVGLAFFQLFSIMPVYFKNNIGLNEAQIGALLALNGLLIVLIEMVLVYKLENKRNITSYLFLGAVLMGASFLSLNIAPILSVALISIIIITFGEMLLFPFINTFWVKRSNDRNRGQYAAVFTISFALANVFAPTGAALFATYAGFSALWFIDFGICIIAGIGFLFLKKHLQ